jgi:hypothetical protein
MRVRVGAIMVICVVLCGWGAGGAGGNYYLRVVARIESGACIAWRV